jgi:hypothetical protein
LSNISGTWIKIFPGHPFLKKSGEVKGSKSYKSKQVLTIFFQQPQRVFTANMKFTTGFIVSILTASVYGLATAPIAREIADIEVC